MSRYIRKHSKAGCIRRMVRRFDMPNAVSRRPVPFNEALEFTLQELAVFDGELAKHLELLDKIFEGSIYTKQTMTNPHKCWSCGSVIQYDWLNIDDEDLSCPVCESINVTKLDI